MSEENLFKLMARGLQRWCLSQICLGNKLLLLLSDLSLSCDSDLGLESGLTTPGSVLIMIRNETFIFMSKHDAKSENQN